jgi:hypothetical protein
LFELLEARVLPSITLVGQPSWAEQGPAPVNNGNNVIIPAQNNPQAGAIQALAVDPLNPNRVFAATVNGGVWRTTDFTDASPNWVPLTDPLPSLSMGDVEFSPLDATNNTLFASVGRFSNGFGDGGPYTGILKTTDGGNTWAQLGQSAFSGLTVGKVIPTALIDTGTGPGRGGQVLLAQVYAAQTNNPGLFRSTDGGATWTKISGGATSGLPGGAITDLVADPGNTQRFYVGMPAQFSGTTVTQNGGVFVSTDGGVTWNNVSAGVAGLNNALVVRLAVHNDATTNAVYAADLDPTFNATGNITATPLGGVSRSTNQGGGWTAIGGTLPNPNPGQQTGNFSLAADPANANFVFLSGDRGTANNAGDVFRGDAGTNTWTSLANGGASGTAPHPDSRSMTFDAGVLLETNDGGVYRLTNPDGNPTDPDPTKRPVWGAALGNIRPTEFYSIAFDTTNGTVFGGAQDNGSPTQTKGGSLTGTDETGADGGLAAVDNTSDPNHSIHYVSNTNGSAFLGIKREVYDNTGAHVDAGVKLVVANTGGENLFTVEGNNPGGSTITPILPFVLNAADPTRMIIGTSSLYESTDQGDTLTALGGVTNAGLPPGQFQPSVQVGAVNPGGTFFCFPFCQQSFAPIAYGGFSGGVPNTAVLWVGAGGQLRLRTSGAGVPAVVTSYTGATIADIVLDPTDWHTAFILDANGAVWKAVSDNAGTNVTITNVTGNLSSITSNVRTIDAMRDGTNLVVVVGGQGGVFRTINPGTNSVWIGLGQGLANAIVRDLHYIPPNAGDPTKGDLLVVGTAGRGAWTLSNAAAALVNPAGGTLQINGDQDFANEDDTIRLVRDPIAPLYLDVFINGVMQPVVPLASIQQINVNGLGGNDTLIVDSSNGLISVPNGINYDGGTGFNTLQLVQTGGQTQTSDTYSVGPNTGQGIDTITGPGGTQTVFFSNLAPVTDLVPVTNLTVNGTPSDNAINYSVGSSNSRGLVAIDNFEPLEFATKTNLAIISGAGSDTVNINNPNTPTGLAGVSVTGGSPTNFHTLVVNGVAATVGVNVGTRSIAGGTGTGGAVPIFYNTFSSLIVNAGTSTTTLAVSGSASYVTTPATAADAGTIQTSAIPISFTGFGSGKTLSLTGSGGSASLVVNGTTGNDVFTVDGSGNVAFAGRATIAPTTIASLTINGIGGSDTFNVTGTQPYSSIALAGGGPAASQVANLTGNGTADVTANLGGTTASVTGGGLGNVSLPDIGVVNLSALSRNITLAGVSPGPNAFTVTPTGANTATAQVGTLAPVVNTSNTGSLTVSGVSGGSDSLIVWGTSGPDTIGVSGSSVAVNALKVVNYTNVAALQVNGLAGPNTFNVTPSAAVPISLNGGDPTGVTPGDQVNVVTGPTDTVAFTPGSTSNQGTVVVNSNQPITFTQVAGVGVNGAGTARINDTTGSDTITVTARDGSYAAGATGVQDFTVSVNAGPNLLFLKTPSLVVNSLAGNDQVALKAPAPNLAAWNENVSLVVSPSPAVGNQLAVIALGTAQSTYAPTSAGGGSLGISNVNGAVANVALTNIASFVYDGQAGGDRLTMVGNGSANVFQLTPGSANDAGTLSMDSTLPVAFQNLGAGCQVVVNGNGATADALTYYGTGANDSFTVNSSTTPVAGGQVNLNARVPLFTTAVQTLTLLESAGADTFTLVPTIAASPYTKLNLIAAAGTGSQANLTAKAATVPLTLSGQTVTQGGKTVAGSGLANINLNGAGNDLTYNAVVSVTENINVISSPTAHQGQVSSPGVALWSFTNVPVVYVNNASTADNDTLTFTGTNNSNTWQINLAAAGTDADPVLKLQDAAAVNTLLTLGNYTGFQTLNVTSLSGSDVFNAYVAPVTTIPGRQLFINAEPSIGKKLTNVLNVFYAKPKPRIIHSTSTQDPDEGLVSADYGAGLGSFLIQFDGIPKVTIQQQG